MTYDELWREYCDLKADNDALKTALTTLAFGPYHTTHRLSCNWPPCTCGLDDARASALALVGGGGG